jgi:hypothetical protein
MPAEARSGRIPGKRPAGRLALGLAALGGKAALFGASRWTGRKPRRPDKKGCLQTGGQTLPCQLAVAPLGALLAHHDAHDRAEPLPKACSLRGAQRGRHIKVETQLHARVRGVRMLAAGPATPAEAPLKVLSPYYNALAHNQVVVDSGHHPSVADDKGGE